jgi:hypothetical protein
MVLCWNQRRKQGSNFGVGGQGLLLGVQNQGCTTVLSQKGDGCIVFTAVLFFVDSAVFFICKEVLRHKEFLHGVRTVVKQASNNPALWIPL